MLHFGKIPKKICQNLAKMQQNSEEILQNFVKHQQNFQQFLKKKLRLENGAKECILQISTRPFQRVFICKIWLRYSGERALKSSKVRALGNLILNFEISKPLFATQAQHQLQCLANDATLSRRSPHKLAQHSHRKNQVNFRRATYKCNMSPHCDCSRDP